MPNPIATCTTSMGTFKLEIFLDRVPITASNFIDLAQSGFYNGIHFHRVRRGTTATTEPGTPPETQPRRPETNGELKQP